MALEHMVKIGDKVRDSEGDIWTITGFDEPDGNIAFYDKQVDQGDGTIGDDCFIARFSIGESDYTYNTRMTLVGSDLDWPESESRINVIGQNGNTGEHYDR